MTDAFRPKPKNWKEPKDYAFQAVNDPLKKVYFVSIDQLKKEPQEPPTFYIVKTIIETCFQTYGVIVDLVSSLREKRYPIQAHMLSRSFVDAYFLVMALLDDPENTRKYEVAGFKKVWEEYEEEKVEYKDLPDAKGYLDEKTELIKHMIDNFFPLTPEEKADPKTIALWPIPGQLIRNNSIITLSEERKTFLKKIYKWHYKHPSSLEHFDWTGIAMNIFAAHPEDHWSPGKFDSDAVYTAQLFLLMMLSEVDASKQYGNKDELKFLWNFLSEYYLEVKEYFEIRYKSILSY